MIRGILFGIAALILLGMYAAAICIHIGEPISWWTMALVVLVSAAFGYAFRGEMP